MFENDSTQVYMSLCYYSSNMQAKLLGNQTVFDKMCFHTLHILSVLLIIELFVNCLLKSHFPVLTDSHYLCLEKELSLCFSTWTHSHIFRTNNSVTAIIPFYFIHNWLKHKDVIKSIQ